jgi:hypothetical protein
LNFYNFKQNKSSILNMTIYTRKKLGGTYLLVSLALLAIVALANSAPLRELEEEAIQQKSTALPKGTE